MSNAKARHRRRWRKRKHGIVDIRLHGVTADGIADDLPAFRKAMNQVKQWGGGTVLLAKGNIMLKERNTSIRGQGSDRTIIKAT